MVISLSIALSLIIDLPNCPLSHLASERSDSLPEMPCWYCQKRGRPILDMPIWTMPSCRGRGRLCQLLWLFYGSLAGISVLNRANLRLVARSRRYRIIWKSDYPVPSVALALFIMRIKKSPTPVPHALSSIPLCIAASSYHVSLNRYCIPQCPD